MDTYLDALDRWLDGCHIAKHQVPGSRSLVVTEARKLAATFNPELKAENLKKVSSSFERFDWVKQSQRCHLLPGTKLAFEADHIAGVLQFSITSKAETFMSPRALGLDANNESWWVGFQGTWCPGFLHQAEICSLHRGLDGV